MVWPENSSDIDPLRNPDAPGRGSPQAADAIGAPILVGAVLPAPAPGRSATPASCGGPAPAPDLAQLYIKRHPVPFAEYVPLRGVARMVSDKVDLVAQRLRGRRTAGRAATPARRSLGDVICFEVAYDGMVRDTVTGGAQLLVVQTNNATFNVAEARQQLAMVRLRAVEHGRTALMASTVGVSGFVDPRRAGTATPPGSTPGRSWCGSCGSTTARTLATRLAGGRRWPWPGWPWPRWPARRLLRRRQRVVPG